MRIVGFVSDDRGKLLPTLAGLLVLFAACLPGPSAPAPTPDPLAGRYSVSGGTSAIAMVTRLTEAFSKLHTGVIWVIEDVGSDAGVQLAAEGRVDLGMISRDLKEAEKGLVQKQSIGFSGTAVAVNAANSVSNLGKQQVRDIFAGRIGDWAGVGGSPGKVVVLVREAGSSTRASFESYFFEGKATYAKEAIEVFDIEEMIKALRSFTHSVGMVTLDRRTLTEPEIRLVGIDGVAATRENLVSGAYKLRRPLFLTYDPTKLKPAIRAFLDFVRSPEGQRIIEAN